MNDLIYRDALMKDLRGECPESEVCISGESCTYCIVRRQPAINRWISCDEKLPDDGQICIVKRKFSYKVPCPYMIGVWSSDRNIFSGLRLGTKLEDAIAWMPFIEPEEV